MMTYVQIDEKVCIDCGVCVEGCPTDVLRKDERLGKYYLAYPDDCEVCFMCAWDCPVKAIRVSATGWAMSRP